MTGPFDPGEPKPPGYDAWVEEQLREAARDLEQAPGADFSEDDVFASLDRIIRKYEVS